ncbi:hypothetical protein [Actinacidiphila oryziradicis]|jgi:hypothetical protein|uniref:hypothetical protein n=1 Tax=Actinacidiphila oryziradicis TaxID=2571141 RepID=UPI0023F38817|nr:hypothetical protein [Actinacidiphila oryziradicis]MCW2873477.1 hypothetical protein [Actinacidiphila oryziradicis]
MATASVNPPRGSTALRAEAAHHQHPYLRLGAAFRAIRVFADTAFRVVVLGTDGTPR